MKRIAIIATAIMVAAACSKTSVVFEDADSEIGIAPVARMSVKAPISGIEYDTNENFGIFAWHRILASGQTSAGWTDFSSGATAENAPVYINNGRFASETVGSTTLWGGDPQAYYWPKTGVLAFAGYSPYDITDQNGVSVSYDTHRDRPGIRISGISQGDFEYGPDNHWATRWNAEPTGATDSASSERSRSCMAAACAGAANTASRCAIDEYECRAASCSEPSVRRNTL